MSSFKLTVSETSVTLEGPIALLTFTEDRSERLRAFVQALQTGLRRQLTEDEIKSLLQVQEVPAFGEVPMLSEKGWRVIDDADNRDNQFWASHIGKDVVITSKSYFATTAMFSGYLAEEGGYPFADVLSSRFEKV